MDLVDYVTALYKVIYEKPKENEVPIVLNKEFYEKSIKELSPQETKKAEKYLDAVANYPTSINFSQVINPKSNYKQNILEQEAYAITPWYCR